MAEQMKFYRENESEGALFQNTRKERDSQPDVNGRVMICAEDLKHLYEQAKAEGGALLYINGWYKEGRNGKFISLSPKAQYRAKPPSSGNVNDSGGFFGGDAPKESAPPSGGGSGTDFDDSIPF